MHELWHCDKLPVLSVLTSLIPFDDVNVDDSNITLTDGDDVTSLTYIVIKMNQFKKVKCTCNECSDITPFTWKCMFLIWIWHHIETVVLTTT